MSTTRQRLWTLLCLAGISLLAIALLPGCGGSSDPAQSRVNPADGAAMVWVPGGTFTMGSPDGVGDADERPAHQVTLDGYWLYRYEVTVAQYRAFCADSGDALPAFPVGRSWEGKTGWDDPTLQTHPMVNVNWDDANAYAKWAGAQLPTEAQWEYAARGTEGRNYPWGGTATVGDLYNGWDETKCANGDNSSDLGISTWPVGSFPSGVSWRGAHDLAGNVWEWVADWYGPYPPTAVTNPTGSATGTTRVIRGGSWNYDESGCLSRLRGFVIPTSVKTDVGFRCVIAP